MADKKENAQKIIDYARNTLGLKGEELSKSVRYAWHSIAYQRAKREASAKKPATEKPAEKTPAQ